MKSVPFFKLILILATLIAIFFSLAFGQDVDSINRFETEYSAWQNYYEENLIQPGAYLNDHLMEIADMGVPVLPQIIEKMEKHDYKWDFQLETAFSLITRKTFEKEDWPEGARGDARTAGAMYIDWWHNGLKDTEKSFNGYYQEWKNFLAEKNPEEAKIKLKNIKNLGIAAIPFMMEKIKNGDLQFIKIISDHTNGSLNENASKDESINWWNANKDKYTIVQHE